MTNVTVSLYDQATGKLSGVTVTVPLESVDANIPDGWGYVPGRHDHTRFHVLLADDGFGNACPAIAPCKPAKPFDSDLVTWGWDEAADEWVAHPTLAANRSALRAARNAELQATDGAAIAMLEALLQGVLAASGLPLPDAVQRLLDHRNALRAMPQRPDFDSLSVADVPRYVASTITAS